MATTDPTRIRKTTAGEWIGATIQAGLSRPTAAQSKTKFHIFKAQKRRLLFAITNGSMPRSDVGTGRPETWDPFKVVPELGKPRVGFTEEAAKADIEAKGYHLVKLKIG